MPFICPSTSQQLATWEAHHFPPHTANLRAPIDIRSFFLDLNHHPEKLPQAMEEMRAKFGSSNKAQSNPATPSNAK